MKYFTLFCVFASVIFFAGCGKDERTIPEQALDKAIELHAQARKDGVDLSAGPCLSNALFEGTAPEDQWVVDIAHNPRVEADNYEVNQCSAYLRGGAKHFIELDPDGNLIKYF